MQCRQVANILAEFVLDNFYHHQSGKEHEADHDCTRTMHSMHQRPACRSAMNEAVVFKLAEIKVHQFPFLFVFIVYF